MNQEQTDNGEIQRAKEVRGRVSSVVKRYYAHHCATNSSKSAKPSFASVDREERELEIRKSAFREELERATERLGDMSVFDKYRRKRNRSRDSPTGRITERKRRPLPLNLSTSTVPEDLHSVTFHRRLHSQGLPDLPNSTRTVHFPSPKERSLPMHKDPQYRFFAHRRTATAGDCEMEDRGLRLDGVVSKCKGVRESCAETRKETAESAKTAIRTVHQQLEQVMDILETLQSHDPSSSLPDALQRRRASKFLRRRLLANADEVKKSFLDTSEFVAKHVHKGIWRFSTLSLARHADKLINSLPITRGAVKGKS